MQKQPFMTDLRENRNPIQTTTWMRVYIHAAASKSMESAMESHPSKAISPCRIFLARSTPSACLRSPNIITQCWQLVTTAARNPSASSSASGLEATRSLQGAENQMMKQAQ